MNEENNSGIGFKVLLVIVGGFIGGLIVYGILSKKTNLVNADVTYKNELLEKNKNRDILQDKILNKIEKLENDIRDMSMSLSYMKPPRMLDGGYDNRHNNINGYINRDEHNNKEELMASYNNKEEWIVKRNTEGKIEGITVSRDAKKTGS